MATESEKRGFTGMEIFIVVVIMCIMSAVVVPQFSRASNQARLSQLMSDLQKVRAQLELYKIQHDNLLPGQAIEGGPVDTKQFIIDMSTTGSDGFGPYIEKFPKNVFNGLDTIYVSNDPENKPEILSKFGWMLNIKTGEFRACDCEMNMNY
jgi:general secretion pathway protein G